MLNDVNMTRYYVTTIIRCNLTVLNQQLYLIKGITVCIFRRNTRPFY